jgi:isopenicillin-N epimerase
LLEPFTVSFGWQSDTPNATRMVDFYEYIGTRDYSAFLSVPAAIEFQAQHNWDAQRTRTHALAGECIVEIARLTGQQPLYPADSNWYAQMVTAPITPGTDLPALKEDLYSQYHIEIPTIFWNNRPMVRVSFQAYNSHQDLETLLTALSALLHL